MVVEALAPATAEVEEQHIVIRAVWVSCRGAVWLVRSYDEYFDYVSAAMMRLHSLLRVPAAYSDDTYP